MDRPLERQRERPDIGVVGRRDKPGVAQDAVERAQHRGARRDRWVGARRFLDLPDDGRVERGCHSGGESGVNFQSLLAVLCCAIVVSTFLGEDLEEA